MTTLDNIRKLRSKYYRNVKHLKEVRSLGYGKSLINIEQDTKLKKAEQHQHEREVFFNNLSKSIMKGNNNEKL